MADHIPDEAVTPVRVELSASWPGGSAEETVEIDRAEWDVMTPAERRQMLEDDAQAMLADHGATAGFVILGDDEGGDEDDPAALPVLDTTKDTEIAALRAALDAVAAEHEHTYLDVHYRQCAENVAAYARCDTCGNLPNGTLHCPTLAAASLRGEQ